ncbi:MAG: WbuC family cupin fold metalloprotein [Desulfuromonadaceae bacterium]|nr:WbuC family cupin fold metalloprotein [Desulfuromonadaceae bacterium]
MKVITRELLAEVSAEARHNPRRRRNHNLHPSDESRCHRLLNAIEPGSYIRPHRHLDPEKDEAFILMSGRLGVVTFTVGGSVARTVLLSQGSGNLAVDIPHGVYHAAISLESGTVFYEAKAGPYRQLNEDEKATWAPEESDPQAQEFLLRLQSLFD